MKEKQKKIIFYIIIGIIFLLIYILNTKTKFVSDDYIYHFLFTGRTPSENTKLISNIFDIITSMTNHWNLWGGRIFNHASLQFIFMLGKVPFDLINSFMFVFLGILIYKHVIINKSYRPFLLLVIYATIFVLAPQPGSTMIWKSGSANYLWVSNVFLIMSLIYKKYYETSKTKDNIWHIILLFILGLIAGCGSENGSVGMIFLLLAYIIIYKRKKLHIPCWSISGLFGCILGFIFLIIAPGNYIRADLMYAKKTLSIEAFFEDFLHLTHLSYEYLIIVIILIIISTVAIHKKEISQEFHAIIKQYNIQIIYIIAAVASIFSLILSPFAPERSWFFAFVFLLITFFTNITKISYKTESLYKAMIATSLIITIIFTDNYAQAYDDINNSNKLLNKQETEIKKQIKKGEKDIVVHSITSHEGKYNAFADNGYLTSNKDSWFNLWMAKYLNVDSIIAID